MIIKVDKASKKASESISKIKGKLILEVTKEKNVKKMKNSKKIRRNNNALSC